ncbi:cobalt transporter [Polymorphobacter glacialis]|uniref:Cobalt transporter n=1 Tax=Sandarakinorhabdus glacialis TaxID=1614636 RepID=A0A916ZQD9_9SPHN|nr:cation diffusion facilitator family transporter [Polymorphobacter glacialis]GGE09010.1 cobalt transporter [Polymorphobacter glacialis]
MAGHDHETHDGHAGHGQHGHSHAPKDFGTAFAVGIGLNLAYVIAEAGFGVATGSMALLADAGHNLSDVLGLAVAWAGLRLATRAPSARFTYGLKRSGILAALANAVFLFVACGAIAVEAFRRLGDPQPVPGVTVMVVAGMGILVNGFTAWLFSGGSGSGKDGDVNIRGAYLHMLADAGISAAVVVAGLIVLKTGAYWVDPALSLIVVAVILRGTWGLMRESVALALDAVPPGIDPEAVTAFLGERPGVAAVHHLHIWPMGTTDTAMTAHLVMPGGHPGDAVLAGLAHDVEHKFRIGHATFQVEIGAVDCRQAACV